MHTHSFFYLLEPFSLFLLSYTQEVFAIVVLSHGLSEFAELLFVYPTALVGNFLQTSHLQSLTLLNNLDKGGGFAE